MKKFPGGKENVGPDLGPNCLQRLSADHEGKSYFWSNFQKDSDVFNVNFYSLMYFSISDIDSCDFHRCSGSNSEIFPI